MNLVPHIRSKSLIHALFWVIIIMLGVYHTVRFSDAPPGLIILRIFSNLLLLMAFFYTHYEFLIPKLAEKGKWGLYILSAISFLIIGAWTWEKIDLFIGFSFPKLEANIWEFFRIGGIMILLATSTVFRISDTWNQREELKHELDFHQMKAELNFLKAQINPHFLLNILNNIYTLIETKAPEAGPAIMSLSEMMRYMLYESNVEKVLLEKEINYIQNYISLQQLKKDGEMKIDLELEGDFHTVSIPPMLIFPFFENAFKHGNFDMHSHGWIKSRIRANKKELSFFIENSIDVNKRKTDQAGVKIENIQQRLALLYPEKHKLKIENEANRFLIKLKIDLS